MACFCVFKGVLVSECTIDMKCKLTKSNKNKFLSVKNRIFH